ncbi:MAG: ATP-binding protein [Oscillospiraceae bacterium]|nr:ATP-binding protein [Oscillospiraceae bacterium]
MAYSKELFEYGRSVLNRRRQQASQSLTERKQELYSSIPRLAQIENELLLTGYGAIRAAMSGGQGLQQLKSIKEKNLSLQQERRGILQSVGLPEDYLTEPFSCSICRDTGYKDGKRCQCYEKILREEAFRRLNSQTPLSLCDFSNFDLSYYPVSAEAGPSPKEQMANILQYCRHYAQTFSFASPNLLMSGRTGLGKTHLSLSIAKSVIENGFGVIYGSAPDFLSQIERERFSRTENDLQTLELMLACDLLILDDLGAEFSTTFTCATIYQLMNSRLNKQLPTIISTNLTSQELLKLYGERVSSRLIGSYVPLFFAGQDIRQKKEQAALS